MTPDVQRQAFDPFFTTKFAGRGLGMAAVLGIVRSHRAAITVESNEGKGSTFRVYFPMSDRPAQPEPQPPQFVNARFKGTILVVDDEATVRQLAYEILKKLTVYGRTGKIIKIKWRYEEDDEAMLELGEHYRDTAGIPLEIEMIV